MNSFAKEIDIAVSAAKEAGEAINKITNKTIDFENSKDLKLKEDKIAEAIILNHLKETNIDILSEECGDVNNNIGSEYRWIVDPIDGTYNYFRGLTHLTCISIALVNQKNEPKLGVIYQPYTKDLYIGNVDTKEATLNGCNISTSNITSLSKACVGTGLPTNLIDNATQEHLIEYLSIMQTAKKIRMLGSAALMGVYVGSGNLDIYIENKVMLWDIAAAAAISIAAGGHVTIKDIKANYTCSTLICANKELADDFNSLLKK